MVLRAAAFRLLRLSLLPLLVRETIQRRKVTVLLYHDPRVDLFEKHVEVLTSLYSVIPLRSMIDGLTTGGLNGLPAKSLVITFDDGHRRNFELKPVLDRRRLPVTMFVCSDIVGTRRPFWFLHVADEVVQELAAVSDRDRVERLRALEVREGADADERDALSREEILELAGTLVDFQSHTATHPFLPRCPDEKARHEIFRAKVDLEREYGFDVYALSYPNGDYSEREVELAREAGYACACTVDSGFNSNATDPFRIKRIAIDDEDGLDELVVKASGLWGVTRRRTAGLHRILSYAVTVLRGSGRDCGSGARRE